jgi:hypothetical protein
MLNIVISAEETSAAPIPMHLLLGEAMLRWCLETLYAGEGDWVFASFRLRTRRFGWHDFR